MDKRNNVFTGEESNIGVFLIIKNMDLTANFGVFIEKLANYMM